MTKSKICSHTYSLCIVIKFNIGLNGGFSEANPCVEQFIGYIHQNNIENIEKTLLQSIGTLLELLNEPFNRGEFRFSAECTHKLCKRKPRKFSHIEARKIATIKKIADVNTEKIRRKIVPFLRSSQQNLLHIASCMSILLNSSTCDLIHVENTLKQK